MAVQKRRDFILSFRVFPQTYKKGRIIGFLRIYIITQKIATCHYIRTAHSSIINEVMGKDNSILIYFVTISTFDPRKLPRVRSI